MIIKRAFGLTPALVTWLDKDRAIFEIGDQKFGIVIERVIIPLSTRYLFATNVDFGIRKDDNFTTANDLDLDIAKFKNIRHHVLSTVGETLINDEFVIRSDIVTAALSMQPEYSCEIHFFIANDLSGKNWNFRRRNKNTIEFQYRKRIMFHIFSQTKLNEKEKNELYDLVKEKKCFYELFKKAVNYEIT